MLLAMFDINKVCTFRLWSPIDIILDGDDYYEIKPLLTRITPVLGITVDTEVIEKTFFETPFNQGDILVFGDHAKNCIVFDLYHDPSDQLDIIEFGVVCSNLMYSRMYELFYSMYKEVYKKVKFSAYDLNTPVWAKAIINGVDFFTHSSKSCTNDNVVGQKIRYIK